MSPASQGNLEVERYIGSCLISSTVRVSGNGGGVASVVTNTHKNKKVADGSGGGGPRPTKLLNTRAGSCQDNNYHQQHHHGSYNGVVPLCECGGLKYNGGGGAGGGARYGSAGRSWAGMPLISMASTGTRRNRKPSTGSTGSAGAGKNCKGGDGEPSGQQTRTPLSRLAIHTQGAPLILAGRYNNSNRKNNGAGGNNKGQPVRQYPARKYTNNNNNNNANNTKDAVPTVRDARNVGGVVASTPSSDNVSIASDESSGHSENSLPRIIKPRKRRKKDRKPPPPTANPTQTTDCAKTSEPTIQESSNIVTLKPYVPLCYELYDSGRRKAAWEAPKASTHLVIDDERASQTSEEDAHDPKLHHEFEDVEEEDVISALFPYPCPSTSLCQCRYCDPAGLIWDVDQHCYSPFLTPPSPGNDNSFTNSPFANIPLFLNPPSRSFDLFDSKDSSSVFMPENDNNSGLRRSWSDPSASHSSHNSFPDFGLGTIGWCDNSRLGSTSSEVSSTSTMSSLTSQSLEVSTEIVTSPNGHRDIEIKFYSSSPPTAAAAPRELQTPNCESNNTSLFSSSSSCGGVWTNLRDDSAKAGWGCSDRALWGVDQCGASDYEGVWDHEHSAKRLGEEVNQLRLHVEE